MAFKGATTFSKLMENICHRNAFSWGAREATSPNGDLFLFLVLNLTWNFFKISIHAHTGDTRRKAEHNFNQKMNIGHVFWFCFKEIKIHSKGKSWIVFMLLTLNLKVDYSSWASLIYSLLRTLLNCTEHSNFFLFVQYSMIEQVPKWAYNKNLCMSNWSQNIMINFGKGNAKYWSIYFTDDNCVLIQSLTKVQNHSIFLQWQFKFLA